MDNDADLALVERCRRGDWSAFSELVVRYQRPIYNAAFWVLRRPEDAKDITQIVFLKVAERLDDYDPKFKFFSWIYRIAINESNRSSASSTSIPRYRTVLSIFVWPSRIWTARRFPVCL